MARFLRRLLNLQPGEGRTIGVLYLLGFVVATSLVWGGAIGRGLFLKRIGIDWLPLMFVFDALLTLPITVIYAAVVDRVSNARLLATIFGGAGLVLLAGWGLLMLDQWVVPIPYVIAVYALFYLGERLLRALFAVHVWTFFNDYLDIRAAKRAFPILGSTSRVAGIVSGSVVAVLAGFLPAQDLVLAWVGVLAVGFWLSLRIPHWLAAKTAAPQAAGPAPARPRRSAFGAFRDNLREGFRFVSSSSFLRWLAVGAFAMTALLVLMDYQAQRVFTQAYTTAEDLVWFYGLLETIINLIALPVQMLLISRLVSWLGVARVNLFFPVGSLIIYAALSLRPTLPSAAAGQFGRDTFRSSVQVPVDNMLYNAVPLPVKGRARAFVKGLLLPLATVTVGLILLPVRGTGALPWWIVGVGGAAVLVQFLAALMVRRRYTQALVAMLAEEDFSAYRLAGAGEVSTLVGPPDPATFRRLIQYLRDSDDEDTSLFLARVVAEVGGREAEAPLVEVAAAAGPAIQAGILETLLETETAGPATLDLARASLQGGHPRLRRAALTILERLIGAGDPALWALAAPLLDDPDPGVRSQALLLLVRCGDIFYVAEAVRALQDLLADEAQPAHRVAGIRVLKDMGDARMVRNLVPYLEDTDDAVRLQAARAVEVLADPQAPDWALDLARQAVARGLGDPAEGVRLSALRALGKVGGEGARDRLLAALGDPSDLVRDQAGLGLAAMGREVVPSLEGLVGDLAATEGVRQAAATVLGQMARDRVLGGSQAHQILEQAQDLMEETLRLIYADARLVAALQDPAAIKALAVPQDAPVLEKEDRPDRPGQAGEDGQAAEDERAVEESPASPPGLDALLPPGVGRRRGERLAPPAQDEPGLDALLPPGVGRRREERPTPPAEDEPGLEALLPPGQGRRRKERPQPADKENDSGLDALLPPGLGRRRKERPERGGTAGADPAAAAGLLCEGLRQRNGRRLDALFSLLRATRREPPATIDVIAATLKGSPAGSPAHSNALEALESLTSSRLVQLVALLTPLPSADWQAVAQMGQEEWDLEPLTPRQALETVLADPDRWLAAIGIVLAGDAQALDAAGLREKWLPLWLADADPAVREAAYYAARRANVEVETVEDTQVEQSLSAVERAIFLKQVPFFGDMTVDQLRTLGAIAEEQYFDESDVIFAEGTPGQALYVVVGGRVGIEREPKEGRVQRLETLSARHYFGERTIFDGAPHENRAVALDRVHLLVIRREPLVTLIRRSPDLSLSLVEVLSQRLREADAKLASRTRTKPDQVMRLYDRLTGDEDEK